MKARTFIDVLGLCCHCCASTIEKFFSEIDGVENVFIDLHSKKVEFVLDSEKASLCKISAEIKKAGFGFDGQDIVKICNTFETC